MSPKRISARLRKLKADVRKMKREIIHLERHAHRHVHDCSVRSLRSRHKRTR
jgi:hypothetical protein